MKLGLAVWWGYLYGEGSGEGEGYSGVGLYYPIKICFVRASVRITCCVPVPRSNSWRAAARASSSEPLPTGMPVSASASGSFGHTTWAYSKNAGLSKSKVDWISQSGIKLELAL